LEIYLDNCATTKVCDEAVKASLKAMTGDYGNPSSLHKKGMEAEAIINSARKTVASVLGCDADNIIFTSGATESNNLAIIGGVLAKKRRGKTIVTDTVEHPSVSNAVAFFEKEGYKVKKVAPHSDGNFLAEDFVNAVDDDTVLLTFMMVNNELGTVFPYEEIVKKVRKKYPDILIHIDAVQGFTKFPLNVKKVDADFVTFSGHKIYAPKGVGGLYIKKGVRIEPLFHGGGQEKNLRSGTQSVPLIAGLEAAIKLCCEKKAEISDNYRLCNQYLKSKLADIEGVFINSPENASDHVVNISVNGVPSEIMLHFLEQNDIYVSSGSACAKGEKSTVLKAAGIPDERVKSALRISFSKDTTTSELDTFLEVLRQGITRFRSVIKQKGSKG